MIENSLLLVYVIFSWLWGIALYKKYYLKPHNSLSMIAAGHKSSYKLMAVGLSGSAILFLLSLNFQLKEVFLLSPSTLYAGYGIAAAQIMIALSPDTRGVYRLLHRAGGYAMGVLYIGFAYLLLKEVGTTFWTFELFGFLVALVPGLILFRNTKSSKFIILECLYNASFHALLLAAVYIS